VVDVRGETLDYGQIRERCLFKMAACSKFVRRFEKNQPLAALATHGDFSFRCGSRTICCLLPRAAPDRHIVIPRLDAETDTRNWRISHGVPPSKGVGARIYHDEEAARNNVTGDLSLGRYPCS